MKQIETSSHLAEIYVGYKTKPKQKDLPKIKSSQDAYEYLMQVWDENRLEHVEECIILPVNRQNKVLGWAKVSTGGVSSTIIALTKKIKEASNFMEIELLDHLIIISGEYYSFVDEGRM